MASARIRARKLQPIPHCRTPSSASLTLVHVANRNDWWKKCDHIRAKADASLRGTNATKQCAATCVALHCLAVAYDDGVRCRKINTIWLASTADMARKSVPAAAHIPPNTRPAKWAATFCPSRGLQCRQLICPSGRARTNAVSRRPRVFLARGPWGGQNPAFPARLSFEIRAAESETRVDSTTGT